MAPQLVVRLGRRRSAWEKTNPREIAEVEFDSAGATAAKLQPCPGETRFTFTNAVHAELLLPGEDELLALVGKLLARFRCRAALSCLTSKRGSPRKTLSGSR